MTLKAVLICQSGGTAYSSKVKAAFSFFDEIFHSASAAIRPEYLIRFHFQCCDMKGIQMDYLSIRLFNFKNNLARMAP